MLRFALGCGRRRTLRSWEVGVRRHGEAAGVSWHDGGVLIGYAYSGGDDRDELKAQLEALDAAGCEQRFVDEGAWRERPELERALSALRDGRDCLVVCRLDRLGRSLRDLIATLAELDARGIDFQSIDDGIATGGTAGSPVGDVVQAFARFDRVWGRERTRADVTVERSRERHGERPFAARSRSRTHGLEFAPDLIEPIVGFRHWRLVRGALSSMFSMTRWETADMTARCAGGSHDPAQTPSPQCTCGVYAYYEPCPLTASAMSSELVGGAVVVWGRVEAHATGVRAEHARIVALDLPVLGTRKRRAVTQIAERLGVRAIPHRHLKTEALTHGAPLPSSLRPPRQRASVTTRDWLTEGD
jgi:DNA invertase Pin-like site-specific DNA recombinase